jgi:predicted RND superfamily exporter protein
MSSPKKANTEKESAGKSDEFLTRPLRLIIIGGSVLLLLFCVWSAAEARKQTSNRIVDWLPRGTQELDVFIERYHNHFAEGEYLMVSWKGCDINDERLDTIAETLTSPLSNGDPSYFHRVMSTRSIIEILTDRIPQLSEEGVKNRLAGWLIGQDRQTACLVLVPNPEGWQRPADGVAFLRKTVKQITGLPDTDIYIAGTSIDSVEIDEISKQSQRTLLPFFLLFSLFLLLCCLRHYFGAFLVFWAAIINEELAGTLLFWCGAHVDSISMLNSSLVYVLTISGGVHLINYYRKTLAEMKPGEEKNAPMQTFHKAILPCSLAAFTTILGMGSLGVSKMIPIQTFGIFASLTLFLGTIWFFLYILSALQERPIRQWFPQPHSPEMPEAPSLKPWERFGLLVFYGRYPITVLTLLSLFIFAFGIKELRTSVTFHGLLPKEAKVLQDYRTLENQLGGLIPIEVVVHFPEKDWKNRTMLEQLYLLTSLVAELRQADNIDAVVSVLNFLPSLPPQTGGGTQNVSRRAALERWLNQHHEQLKELRFFNTVASGTVENGQNDSGNYWRISLRVSTQKRLNYAAMIADVQERLETVRQQKQAMNVEQVRFDVTGGVPLVFRAQELLLWDLIYSFMTAFCLIALTMMIVLRGIVRGLLAMIPNVFPCVIVFGMLGLFGIPVDMGSMMTASVALGISVDGTLHLLTWVSVALRRGLTRKDAVLYALQRCSTALTQTMIICGVGMLVFGFSDFVPVARFAILLCTILIISLISAIVILPAILFSPLGRFFENSDKDKETAWIL